MLTPSNFIITRDLSTCEDSFKHCRWDIFWFDRRIPCSIEFSSNHMRISRKSALGKVRHATSVSNRVRNSIRPRGDGRMLYPVIYFVFILSKITINIIITNLLIDQACFYLKYVQPLYDVRGWLSARFPLWKHRQSCIGNQTVSHWGKDNWIADCVSRSGYASCRL